MAQTLAHAPSADQRPAQHSTINDAHWRFVGAIGRTTPHSIPYWADGDDVEERAAHIDAVTSAFRDYLAAILADTSASLTTGRIDPSDYLDIIDDVLGDINGRMSEIAHRTWTEAA